MKRGLLLCCLAMGLLAGNTASAAKIFIPMDVEGQTNHIKAYGVAFAALKLGVSVDWLLNYKGGSFGMDQVEIMERMCKLRGVSYQIVSDAQYGGMLNEITNPDFNGDIIKLEKPPKVGVYTPPNKEPWDDAVTLVLTYAEIPFDKLYDDELLADNLAKYDWLHLHHEDFTGQYGKFFHFRDYPWYRAQKREAEEIASKWGFSKVSQLKLAVAKKVQQYVAGGGYMFAMCNATDTYDVALATQNTDIADVIYDGDPTDPSAQKKLDFSQTFAFQNFQVSVLRFRADLFGLKPSPDTTRQTRGQCGEGMDSPQQFLNIP